MSEDTYQLAAGYRDLIIQWGESGSRPSVANQLFDAIHARFQLLRQTQPGRDAIADLLDDASLPVRLKAATHCLLWNPARAIPVLEEIERGSGIHSITARYTLKAYRAGELDLD